MAGPSRFGGYDVLDYAMRAIEVQYGDKVDVWNKGKFLQKFGHNLTVGTSSETLSKQQGTTANETFVSTNIIDSVSSSASGDTSLTITVEGHTIDTSGNLTFVSQNVTTDASDGRTKVTLTTPLARANRAFVANSGTFDSPQTAPSGIIYVYDDTDGITAGVPNTAAATKVLIDGTAGEVQSEKCATSISSQDYWIIRKFRCYVGEGTPTANTVFVTMQIRDVANGGVWRPLGGQAVLIVGAENSAEILDPPSIVPPNHDWRVVAETDTGTAGVFGEADGYLAIKRG